MRQSLHHLEFSIITPALCLPSFLAIYIHVNTCIYLSIYQYTHLSLCLFLYVCMYVCMYVYVCVCTLFSYFSQLPVASVVLRISCSLPSDELSDISCDRTEHAT